MPDEPNQLFSAVIPSGGQSRRMGGENKLLSSINGKPLLLWTIEAVAHSRIAGEIILPVFFDEKEIYEELLRKNPIPIPWKIISGGKTRQESVYNGIMVARLQNLLIHDGARPYLSGELMRKMAGAFSPPKGLIPVLPLNDSLVRLGADGKISEYKDRRQYARVQTPQMFEKNTLFLAHQKAKEDGFDDFTDDGSLFVHYGGDILTVEGDPGNIKVTYKEDLFRTGSRLK